MQSRKVYWQSVARIGVQAAETLHYAHEQGIVHRDVKPGNLLLDSPDVRNLIACASNRYMMLSVGTWKERWVLRRPASAPGAAAFVADSSLVAVVEDHSRLPLLETDTGREVATFDAGFDPGVAFQLEFSPGDGLLVAACGPQGLRAWSLHAIRLQFFLSHPGGGARLKR